MALRPLRGRACSSKAPADRGARSRFGSRMCQASLAILYNIGWHAGGHPNSCTIWVACRWPPQFFLDARVAPPKRSAHVEKASIFGKTTFCSVLYVSVTLLAGQPHCTAEHVRIQCSGNACFVIHVCNQGGDTRV